MASTNPGARPPLKRDELLVPERSALSAAANLFRSLSDPSRLAIVAHLALGEHRVVELTDHLGLAQSTVSAHLRCLLDCGIVEVTARGRASVYSLTAIEELHGVLAAAETLLAATGDRVALCPTFSGAMAPSPRSGGGR